MNEEQQRILSFWWMLELFSPQKIPKVLPSSSAPAGRQVIKWKVGDKLPWDRLSEKPMRLGSTSRVWQHTVYLGVYRIEETYETLHQVFTDDTDAYDARPGGLSACAGVLVDQDGRLVEETATLSSALWAVARIQDRGPADPRWADGFGEAQDTFTDAVDRLGGFRRDQEDADEAPRLDAAFVEQLLKLAHTTAGIAGHPELATPDITIESRAVSTRTAENAGDFDFLNSFYLQDLENIRAHAAVGEIGEALSQYLTSESGLRLQERIDVIERPETVDSGTAIDQLPKGRWPSKAEHNLALSQQFAVNRAVNDLGASAGLLGVNGPPGTGKTTMLRDILAANVVERAQRLAALQDPAGAFTGQLHRWSASSGHPRKVPQLIRELTGFEMIVASANNAAVENVTVEIPSSHAIASPWRGTADYFGEIASATLRANSTEERPGEAESPSAWGLVGARLGKKSNRAAFHSAFWFDSKSSQTKEAKEHEGTAHRGAVPEEPSGAEDGLPDVEGLQTLLKQWADGTVEHRSWAEAREAFSRAEHRVDVLIEERRAAEHRLAEVSRLEQLTRELEARLAALYNTENEVEKERDAYVSVEQQAQEVFQQAEVAHSRHLSEKPGTLETIFTLGRAIRDWRTGMAPFSAALDEARQRYSEVSEQGQRIRDRLEESRTATSEAQAKRDHVAHQHDTVRSACRRDHLQYGAAYPGESWTHDQRELHAPWLDAELDAARSDLFLAALQLHQDLLANTAAEISHGLRAATEVVAGSYPKTLEQEKVRAAWQLFFLVVPLVSTTFASLERMVGNVGAEAFGWLLIDEAGQAAPQYAVGAIWRAQRVIAVGDPLQLQPVVTMPNKAQRDIAGAYHVSPTWIPPRASVQTLADRISLYGTELRQGEDDIWVSAPLKVHRRCDDPMFTLCNRIAYNHIMVNGVPPRNGTESKPSPFDDTNRGPAIAWSYWADEPAKTSGTHLQMNQISRLEKAFDYLKQNGVEPSEVIAISPFRDVADHLELLINRYAGLQAGTIHTAQGREAPVVFLVLGGDPSSPGAKAWAASTVNLVNVAASRAERRLFVIGDRAEWSKHPYFSELSAALG